MTEETAEQRPGWDRFILTACYAADRCQHDLGCPFLEGCEIVNAELRSGQP